jgi:hypothetical protein
MREIDVHDFHRRVILDGEPAFAGLRAAAAVIGRDAFRTSFGDWVAWQRPAADTSRTSFGDWVAWQRPAADTSRTSFGDWVVWNKDR